MLAGGVQRTILLAGHGEAALHYPVSALSGGQQGPTEATTWLSLHYHGRCECSHSIHDSICLKNWLGTRWAIVLRVGGWAGGRGQLWLVTDSVPALPVAQEDRWGAAPVAGLSPA